MTPRASMSDTQNNSLSFPSRTPEGKDSGSQRAPFPEVSELVFASFKRFGTTATSAIVVVPLFILVACFFFPAQYVGSSSIRILQRENYLLSTQQTRSEDANFVRAQSALVLQEQTLALALMDKELEESCHSFKMDSSVEWLKSIVKVEVAPGTDVMNVVAQHPSHAIASHASRALTQSYVANITQQLRANREKRITELEKTASEVDDKLMLQWKILQSKAKELGSGAPQSLSVQEQLKIQTLRENSQRLRALQQQRSQLEIQLLAERNAKVTPPISSNEADIRIAVNQNPEAISLREQILQCDVKIRKVEELVQHKNAPQLVKLQNERAHYKSALDQVESKIEALERQRRSSQASHIAVPQKSVELEQKISTLDGEMNQLRESIAETEASIARVNGPSGVELEIIRHEIERQEKLADQLWKTIQELRIEERAEPRVSLLTLPTGAVKLSRSKQIKAAAAAAGIGCLVAIFCVGCIEWYSCIVRSPQDVAGKAGMRVFGTTKPESSNRLLHSRRRFVAKKLCEGANEIATQLLLEANFKQSIPSILISSANQEEARSAVAIALSFSIKQSGRNVILVACDQCLPLSTNEIKQPNLLSNADWKEQTIYKVSELDFDYLALVDRHASPHWATANVLPDLLAHLAKQYDAVVVLGPSMLSNPATLLISKCLDLTVLVGQFGRTRFDELFASRQMLESANSSILGTLIVPPRSNDAYRKLSIQELDFVPSNNDSFDQTGAKILTELNELQSHAKQLAPPAIFHSPHAVPSPIKNSPEFQAGQQNEYSQSREQHSANRSP